MMRYLDTPVMLMKRNLSIVVLYNHLHILWLYVTGKQKVQFTIAGILECQADLMTELPQFPEVPEILLSPVIHGISFPAFPV